MKQTLSEVAVDLLTKMSNAAFELIKIVEHKKFYIDDGDDWWACSADDAGTGDTMKELSGLIEAYRKIHHQAAEDGYGPVSIAKSAARSTPNKVQAP